MNARLKSSYGEPLLGDVVFRSAQLSKCGRYRYALSRELVDVPAKPLEHWVTFILANPSTADAETDDATVRKCWAYTRAWGFTGMEFVNVNPFRSTEPKAANEHVLSAATIKANDTRIRTCAAGSDLIVAAWGQVARLDHVRRVKNMLEDWNHELHALELSKDGTPKHPLYLKGDLRPFVWMGKKHL